jgi:hypothetical protein
MQAQVVDHGILLAFSAFDHREDLAGKTFRQFLVFQAVPIAATAVTDDKVDVVGRDVAAADVAEVIVFAVKWTDTIVSHRCLIGKLPSPMGESGEGRHLAPDFCP